MRSRRLDTDSRDFKAGQDHPRALPSTGKARLEEALNEPVDRPEVVPVKGKLDPEHVANLLFNEEVLRIIVHDTTDPNDDPIPYVINDGRRQAFIRGEEQDVKRKYVEVLARMKRTTFKQEKYKDSQNIDSIRNLPHTALKHPFTVLHDPNPRGRAWLKAILAEA